MSRSDDEISGEGMSPASYHALKALKERIADVKDDFARLEDSQKGQRSIVNQVIEVQNETQVTLGRVLLQLKIHTWIGAAIGGALIAAAVSAVVAVAQAHIR